MNSREAFNYYHIFQNFTEEEKEAYKPRLKRITETFGYRVDERTGMSAALRMYIISKSDRPMEELIDLSDMPHDELKRYMEWAAECYNQWLPGDINISFDPEYPGYLYDMFQGVDYEINLSKPKGERIENVMFHGEPLADDQILTLAVNNYRYSSGIKAKNLAEGKREWESSNSIRDMIVAYFDENSPVAPTVDGNWKITGVDLGKDDPRRAVLVAYINEGLLPTPYDKSYNLADFAALVAEAEANRAAGTTHDAPESQFPRPQLQLLPVGPCDRDGGLCRALFLLRRPFAVKPCSGCR